MIKRCSIEDLDFVNTIMTHESVYPWITDDLSVGPDEYSAESYLTEPSVYVLSPNPGSIICFAPFTGAAYNQHTCVLPEWRWAAVDAALECQQWLFEKTTAKKIIGFVCASDHRARQFAKKIVTEEGRIKNVILKNGTMQDLIVYGKEA